MRTATFIAALLVACGNESERAEIPASEYVRGVELLAEQGITAPLATITSAPVVFLDDEAVGGYIVNFYFGDILITREPGQCLANTALLHELTHLALYAELKNIDADHQQESYWNAVRTANAVWRAESCPIEE